MANWWSLKIISGPEAGKVFLLNRDRTVIGRVKGDVCLRQDLELSSVHAEIIFDAAKGVLILGDLQSRNGCRVNGEKIEKRALVAGDKLKFGLTELVLEPPSAEMTMVSKFDGTDGDATRVSASNSNEKPLPAPSEPAVAKSKLESIDPRSERSAPRDVAKSSVSENREPSEEKAAASERKERAREPSRRPSEEISGGPEFYGFFGRFFGVLLMPTRFFDFLASENALISGDQAFKSALQFGIITWLVGGGLAGLLSYLCLFVWKVTPPGADFGSSPFAIGLVTIGGALLLPLVALIYHGVCVALGGKGPFKVALRVVCYLTAVHCVKEFAGLIPKAGPFIGMALECYMFYLLALAATRLYYVTTATAYVSCGVSVAITLTVMISTRNSALRMQDQLAKLNPLLDKSIGATIVVEPAPSKTGAVKPAPVAVAAPTEEAPPADTPAPQTTAQESAPAAADADPAPPAAVAATPDAPAPETAAAPNTQQRDPAATDPAPPAAASAANSGDPEPPSFPVTQ